MQRRGLLTAVCTIACAPPRSDAVEPVPPAEPAEPRVDTASLESGARSKPTRVPGRPRIDRASFRSARELTLFFSEPVQPTIGFDLRQFRLSAGGHYREIGYSATYYYELGTADDADDAATFTEIETVEAATLELVLAAPIPTDVCEDAIVDPSGREVAGIFLHYDDRKSGAILDRDGHRLRDIAEAWVLRGADEATYYGVRARPLEALGPIPCDFEGTGAPVTSRRPVP